VKKGDIKINGVLEDCLKRLMESVRDELHCFVEYDILLDNCNSLSLSAKYACEFGISQDFHLLGCMGYTSLFYNIDASTLDHHMEMDWSMTTIYILNQEWKDKLDDHLQFLFHIANKKGIIHISMQPGTIIYFHGSLLTHQQIHNHGEVIGYGCCLNFSAYANQKLLCHYIASINHVKKRRRRNPENVK